MSCEERFFRALRERGFRLTPQRRVILDVLHDVDAPATAEEIHHLATQVNPSIDVSTVYRTLDLLRQLGFVALVDAEEPQRYELLTVEGPHIHLICRECGAIFSADPEVSDSLVEALWKQFGFAVDLSEMNVPGLCSRCAVARNSSLSEGNRDDPVDV